MLSRQEVQHIIAALAPAGGGNAAAAQEVMDSIADPESGAIDFGGFLHFFSTVSAEHGAATMAGIFWRLLSAAHRHWAHCLRARKVACEGSMKQPCTDAEK